MNGITDFSRLREQDPARLELVRHSILASQINSLAWNKLLSRRPPFGHELLMSARKLPQYHLSIAKAEKTPQKADALSMSLIIHCSLLLDTQPDAKDGKRRTSKFLGMTSILTTTSDLELIDYRRIPSVIMCVYVDSHQFNDSTKALWGGKSFSVTATFTKPSQYVIVQASPVSSLLVPNLLLPTRFRIILLAWVPLKSTNQTSNQKLILLETLVLWMPS
jgi:ATP-dependent DNA helicase HFM1/MER3